MHPNYEFTRKLAGRLRQIPGATDVVIQQTMRTPTLMVEGNRTFGLAVNRLKGMASNLLMTTAGANRSTRCIGSIPRPACVLSGQRVYAASAGQ